MSLQSKLASIGGDMWRSWQAVAIFPYPATVIGWPKTLFTWDDYRCFTNLMKPGDMILTRSGPAGWSGGPNYFLSNKFIGPTSFKHLAVYTGSLDGYRGKDGYIHRPRLYGTAFKRTIIHAVSDGVICQDVGELLFHSDYAVAIRPGKTRDEQYCIVQRAIQTVGLGYNFDFKPTGPKELYCTELGVKCLQSAYINEPETFDSRVSLNPFSKKFPVTLADSFINSFDVVCSSVSTDDRRFWKSSLWLEVVRVKLFNSLDAKGVSYGTALGQTSKEIKEEEKEKE